ncbi:MAG TPA: hypothetical protein VFF06_18750 [Polyangia bacterium]|nr:hypothetical protein [Polyangia bacterium]
MARDKAIPIHQQLVEVLHRVEEMYGAARALAVYSKYVNPGERSESIVESCAAAIARIARDTSDELFRIIDLVKDEEEDTNIDSHVPAVDEREHEDEDEEPPAGRATPRRRTVIRG